MSVHLYWIVAALVTGYCNGQSLSTSPVDSYTALVPVRIKCKADERKGLICAAEYPDKCKEQWNFPNPCTQQNLDMNITRFIHPFDTTKFLMCGQHGKLYVVQCPKHEVFHEQCGCVGKGTGIDASCEIPLAPMINNPCTQESILANKLFFPFPGNMSKFIHCDVWGKAWERTCTIDQVWSQYEVACVPPAKLNPCARPTADTNFLYQHPCDPYKYLRCDASGMAYETSCQQGTRFIEAVQGCQSVNSLSYRPEITCGPHTFGFRIYPEVVNTQTGVSGNVGFEQVGLNQGNIHTGTGVGSNVPGNQFNQLLSAWRSSVANTVAIVPNDSRTGGGSSSMNSFGANVIGGSEQGGTSSTFGMGTVAGNVPSGTSGTFGIDSATGSGNSGSFGISTVTGSEQSGTSGSFGIGTATGSEPIGTSGSFGMNTVSMKDTSGISQTFDPATGNVGMMTGSGTSGTFGMDTATGSGNSGSFGISTVAAGKPSDASGSFRIGIVTGSEPIGTSGSFGTNTVSLKDTGGISETFGALTGGGTPSTFGADAGADFGISGSLGVGTATGSGASGFANSVNMGSSAGSVTSGDLSSFSISAGTGAGVSVSHTGSGIQKPSEIHPSLLREYEFSRIRWAEPCTPANVLNTRTHFKLKGNPHEYIQCDAHGMMFLKPCPADGMKKDYFDVFTQTCVDGPIHLPSDQLAYLHNRRRPFNAQTPFVF